jgi:putative endonuclease
MKRYYVYILKCSDGSYYTGMTNDINRRLDEHNYGLNKESYTFNKRHLELVFCTEFNPSLLKVKGWSRKKKEAIIKDKWEDLKKLSKCLNKQLIKILIKRMFSSKLAVGFVQ